MAQSSEYPDLKWVSPRSWTNANRKSVQLLVIHTTEGSAHAQSAEDGAAYDARRADGTSTHYFHDSDSTVQCVRTEDIAHTAKGEGNRRGIHHEICDRTGQNAGQWADAYSDAAIRKTAKQAARDVKKWKIPVRHLTVAQVRSGYKGFCSHHDISRAFGQSTHTDPGPDFPWTKFLNLVKAELAPPKPEPEDITVATPVWTSQTVLDVNFLFQEAWRSLQPGFPPEPLPSGPDRNARNIRNYMVAIVQEAMDSRMTTVEADLDTIKDLMEGLDHDPADGGPSTIQTAIADAIWTRTPRTITS